MGQRLGKSVPVLVLLLSVASSLSMAMEEWPEEHFDYSAVSDDDNVAITVNTADTHWRQPPYYHHEMESLNSQMQQQLHVTPANVSVSSSSLPSPQPYFWDEFSDADALSEAPGDFDFDAEVLDLTGRPQRSLEEDLADREYCERLYDYAKTKEGSNLPYRYWMDRLRNREPRALRHRAVHWKNHESDPETQVDWTLEDELNDPDQFDRLWLFARTKMGSNLPRQRFRDGLLASEPRAILIRKIFWRKERLARGLPVIWSIEEELEDNDQFDRVYAFAHLRRDIRAMRITRRQWAQRLRERCPLAMEIRAEYYQDEPAALRLIRGRV